MSRQSSHFDDWLDTELRDVSAPVGMLHRLRQIPLAGDSQLDAAVRDLPVPRALDGRLRRIGLIQARWAGRRQVAMAVCLVLMIGGSYAGAMLALLGTTRVPSEPPPVRLISRMTVGVSQESDLPDPELDDVAIAMISQETPDRRTLPPPPRKPLFQLAGYQGPSLNGSGERFVGLDRPPGAGWSASRTRAVWPVFPAHYRPGQSPQLPADSGLVPRGAAPPPLDETAQAFFDSTGFSPFVAPGKHSSLRTSVVPLDQDTLSYDLARQLLREGERLSNSTPRTEDFLAAVDYRFPSPEDRPLGLYVSGGPSPFSPDDRRLLHIGVRARDAARGDRPVTRLTVAVDVSEDMGRGGGLEMARRSLGTLVGRLGPDDRISLVAFDDDACVLAEQLRPSASDRLLAAVDSLVPGGDGDIVAGLQQAYAVAYRQAGETSAASRVVLLVDSGARIDPLAARRIAARLSATSATGIVLHVINVGYSRQHELPDPGLMDLARAGGGWVHRATRSDEIGWVLSGIITGESQLVACDVRLQVMFNPDAVAAYRLLGHEVGDVPAEPEIDFRAGQSATALYEVLLAPGKEQNGREIEEVAQTELSWWDPASGRRDLVVRTFRRDDFAETTTDAPLSLQAAGVVAESVEVLRGSPFLAPQPDRWSLTPVLERARQVETALLGEPTFGEFVSFLEQAEAARSR